MKTLVIHPADPSTAFLKVIYEFTDWTIETRNNKEISRRETAELIKNHDRIIMMGHGSPGGLFYTHINSEMVYLLRECECVCIWCHADKFVQRYGLIGFYTGMFISEVREGYWYDIDATQAQIDFSNMMFVQIMKEYINKSYLLTEIKEEYIGCNPNDPVIQFNTARLYYRDEESVLNEKDLRKEGIY